MTIKDLAQLAMDVADALIEVREERDALESGLQALASRFEEVCGELAEAKRQSEVIPLPCPGPGWYWVKGHWRSRNQAIGEPDHPTVQPDPATGQPEASEGRPEGIWPGRTEAERIQQLRDDFEVPALHMELGWAEIGVPEPIMGEVVYLPAQPDCVQTSADSGKCVQLHTGLAVCEWDCERWAQPEERSE